MTTPTLTLEIALADAQTVIALDVRAAQKALGIGWNQPRGALQNNDPCCLCGKGCKAAAAYLICVDGSLDLAVRIEDEDRVSSDPGHMGMQPVGSDCARKLRKLLGADADTYLAKP
jgi:hypothetical protein